jgi:hypothetical protein
VDQSCASDLKGYIDGLPIIDRSVDLTGLPSAMSPTFFGNSYGSTPLSHLVFDNALVRTKSEVFQCVGFEPPLENGPVTVKRNRVLPFKAQLFHEGIPVIPADLTAPPFIQVSFNSGPTEATDVTDEALPAGQGTEGNQFEFDGTWWHFNLETKNFTAEGTYTVSMVSGDATEYVVDPICTAQFVIE